MAQGKKSETDIRKEGERKREREKNMAKSQLLVNLCKRTQVFNIFLFQLLC